MEQDATQLATKMDLIAAERLKLVECYTNIARWAAETAALATNLVEAYEECSG
jgi:hypothetical protein